MKTTDPPGVNIEPTRRGLAPKRAAISAGVVVVVVMMATVLAITTLRHAFTSSSALNNGSRPGTTSYAGITVNPGEVADFSITVENSSSSPVTLERATLILIPGFQAPKLVRLGFLVEHSDLITSARGWPIPKESPRSSGYWAVRPLKGFVVLPWKTRQEHRLGPLPDMIAYGVQGNRPDTDYASAGLLVTYRIGNTTYSQRLYNGGDACVLPGNLNDRAIRQSLYNRYCAAIDRRAIHAVIKLAGGSSS